MFERYTEEARRAIFFTRYEASSLGSAYVEPEHLLLGILREDSLLGGALPRRISEEARRKVEAETASQPEAKSTSVDIPMSAETKRALAFGAEEAEKLGHAEINSGHLVLGILRLEDRLATAILKENEISLDSYRELVMRSIDRVPHRRKFERLGRLWDTPEFHAKLGAGSAAHKLEGLIVAAAGRFDGWSEKEGSQILVRKPWTRKQALGHLVDCAAAHQQWFAIAFTESKLLAGDFPPEAWIAAQSYEKFAWQDLVDLWVALNRFLVHVIAQIPEEKLSTPCRIGVADPIPLSALISRYVDYCEDILGQVFVRG